MEPNETRLRVVVSRNARLELPAASSRDVKAQENIA